MVRLVFTLCALWLPGCAWVTGNVAEDRLDPDRDGVLWDEDCDDTDPSVSAERRWFADLDGDGYGDPDVASDACAQPDGFVPDATDCDDTRPDVHPGADDVCDEVDQDCDGLQPDPPQWYLDGDGDGVGGGSTASSCVAPEGYVEGDGDCDDADAAVFPGATETCVTVGDDNCDGVTDDGVDAPTWLPDADGDGFGDDALPTEACTQPEGTLATGGDCDDTNDAAYPGAPEACDSAEDLNCDGYSGTDDSDHDGWIACQDCDDGDVLTYPGADEYCDGADNDCDGILDNGEAVDAPTWYVDLDADTYAGTPIVQCAAPTGSSADGPDCDDADPAISPAAVEICGGADEDCDGLVDDDDPDVAGQTDYYVDGDGDGFGAGAADPACLAGPGMVVADTDCDDGDATVSPAGTEACGGGDEDCDGLTDDADSPVSGRTTWYVDADNDTYGAATVVAIACVQPAFSSDVDTDCDDATFRINPGVNEDCATSADDDCDGDTNTPDATGCTEWFPDLDADGWGSGDSQCLCVPSGDFVALTSTDCDDSSGAVNPAVTEACGTPTDDNCDGATNDLSAVDCTVRYLDSDRDGFGAASSECRCDPEGSFDTFDSTDCDDGAADVFPGQIETYYDGIDQACDGGSDYDQDGDGYDSTDFGGPDCGDLDPAVSPAATEVCNDGVDNDCDGSAGACALTGSISAMRDSDAVIYADWGASTQFGAALAVGTVDASGGADLVIGSPGWNGGDGAVYQFLSAPSGVTGSSSADLWLYNSGGNGFGAAVALLRGGNELLVGEPGNDDSFADGGAAWAFSTPQGGDAPSTACHASYGPGSSSGSGGAVALMPDVDGDGAPELVIGSPANGYRWAEDGAVTITGLVSCGADRIDLVDGWVGASASARLGAAVASGDVTGDGVDDIVAAATGDGAGAGGVYLLEVATAGFADAASVAAAEWQGISAADEAGSALFVQDLTGDGLSDVIIGAPQSSARAVLAGQVYVVPGGATGVQSVASAPIIVTGDIAYLHLGASVGVLDLDGDGELDLAVGASGDPDGAASGAEAGHAYLFRGPLASSLGSSAADLVIEGYTQDQLGASMATGDMNSDGRDDWVIGAPSDSYWYYSGGGAAYVIFGSGL